MQPPTNQKFLSNIKIAQLNKIQANIETLTKQKRAILASTGSSVLNSGIQQSMQPPELISTQDIINTYVGSVQPSSQSGPAKNNNNLTKKGALQSSLNALNTQAQQPSKTVKFQSVDRLNTRK